MMKHNGRLLAVVGALLLAGLYGADAARASTLYGPNSAGNPVSLEVTGAWATHDPTITFDVTRNADGTYHYSYGLQVGLGAFSHLLLQTSDTFGMTDIRNVLFNGQPFANYSLGTFGSQGNSNPGIPVDIHGIKFDGLSGTNITLSFDSPRDPVAGSFYTKDGRAGGLGDNAMWNTGLDPNWTGARSYILTPDGNVPEPATMLLVVMGGVGVLLRRSR